MKRVLLFLTLLSIIFSCSRDSDTSIGSHNETNISAKAGIKDNVFVKRIRMQERGVDNGADYYEDVTIDFKYENNRIKEIHTNKKTSGDDVNSIDYFYYSGGKLDNVAMYTDGKSQGSVKFNYHGDKLVSVNYNDITRPSVLFTLDYNSNGLLDKLGYEWLGKKTVSTFYYSGNNINTIYESNDFKNEYLTIQYDDKYNAFRNWGFEEKLFLALDYDGSFDVVHDWVFSFWGENNIIDFKLHKGRPAKKYINKMKYSYTDRGYVKRLVYGADYEDSNGWTLKNEGTVVFEYY